MCRFGGSLRGECVVLNGGECGSGMAIKIVFFIKKPFALI